MSILNEGERDDVDVTFTINNMPLKQFKRFKRIARDWRDNYSVTIQMLMDKSETFEYIMNEKTDDFILDSDEVETLGD